MEKMETVVSEKLQFEERDKSIVLTSEQRYRFSMKDFLRSFELSKETVMEGIKPLNTEKEKFEKRVDSKLFARFGIFFRLLKIRSKVPNKVFEAIFLRL